MQNFNRSEYAQLKNFFSFYVERYMLAESLPPEKQPLAFLEAMEKRSPRMAFQGLRQAINDCVERSSSFDPAEVANLDAELISRGIVTLSELRKRYSRATPISSSKGGSRTIPSSICFRTSSMIRPKNPLTNFNCLQSCCPTMRELKPRLS
ncbi:hypothetical protein [Bradyrhizobium tropiciagri]|uniref:hypothetical protein n=1 Tax=Bradyrhizobium tropiciagri TaxID=312253 RepID=UPI001009A1C9|nr:hypothetical protein [Bradyrhizobium tropiciagri]